MQMEEFRAHTLGLLCDMLDHKEQIRKRELDLPAARVCLRLLNLNRNPDTHKEAFTLQDDAPWLFPPRTPEEIALAEAERMANKAEVMVLNMTMPEPADPNRKRRDTRKKKSAE